MEPIKLIALSILIILLFLSLAYILFVNPEKPSAKAKNKRFLENTFVRIGTNKIYHFRGTVMVVNPDSEKWKLGILITKREYQPIKESYCFEIEDFEKRFMQLKNLEEKEVIRLIEIKYGNGK